MDEEYNNIEDEMEKIDEEIKETPKTTSKAKGKPVKEEPQVTERYTAFYQEARIGILDNITKEVIVEGLPDVPTASLEAFKLNKLDKIEIVSGV